MRQNSMLSYLFWINILFTSAVRKGLAQTIHSNSYYGNLINVIERSNLREQCAMQETLLPDPETLCCGLDLSDRSAGIKSGRETELDQFPWSVLIKAGFADVTNDNDLSVYSCGGSLVSNSYVLTAAHCVFRPGDTLVDITITEYDENCDKMGRNPNCVDELLLQAENVVPHPGFDEEKLRHDIALVRLKEYMTKRYVTPICLPKFNIDHTVLANLQLVVAGWGRNGVHVNHIKEGIIVHLVSHKECHRSYPFLRKSQICAAGRMGEDTRVGDSGGPLMMKFEGSYYVIGVVSGRGRAPNSEMGKTMPSLYTSVFRYIHWIRHTIRKM